MIPLGFNLPFALAEEESRCLQCHGNRPAVMPKENPKVAPLLAEQFSMEWDMFEFASEERPPFAKVPEPHIILRGTTHYDWKRQAMTEIYHDKCIDIFPQGRDYRCQFLSLEDKTYLIRSPENEPVSCCLWSKEGFHAPRPDVIRNMRFDTSIPLGLRTMDSWLLDIPLPGPFGYGFYRDTAEPAAFWFPVISGWVQQNFRNYVEAKPENKAFDLPSSCRAEIPVCE